MQTPQEDPKQRLLEEIGTEFAKLKSLLEERGIDSQLDRFDVEENFDNPDVIRNLKAQIRILEEDCKRAKTMIYGRSFSEDHEHLQSLDFSIKKLSELIDELYGLIEEKDDGEIEETTVIIDKIRKGMREHMIRIECLF